MVVTDFLTDGPKPSALQQKNPPREDPTSLIEEDAWIAFRDLALTPLDCSELYTDAATRAEFIEGCRLLGLTYVYPHQLLIADMLNAGERQNGVLLPRQVGKTKTLSVVVIGRCALRPRYNAAMTLATQAGKTHEVFEQTIIDELTFAFPDEDSRPFTVKRGKGSQHVTFPNGSRFAAKTAKGAAFRGSSYDLVWIDEAGEATLEQAADLLGAILPTFLTRAATKPQLVMTGTAGTFRKGQLLYEALKATNGRLRYALEDTVSPEDLETWETAGPLIRAMHPGIQVGLALEDDVRAFFELESTSLESFLREFGGIFGTDLNGDLLFPDWATSLIEAETLPAPPERFALAYAMQRDGKSATVCAAWRDDDGNAHILSMKHRDGNDWVAAIAHDLASRYKTPLAYDTINAYARAEADKIERARPLVKLHPYSTRDAATSAALLVGEAAAGRLRHYGQPALDDAAEHAVKRAYRQSASWGIGPAHPMDDVSPIEAAALALRLYDTVTKERQPVRSTMQLA